MGYYQRQGGVRVIGVKLTVNGRTLAERSIRGKGLDREIRRILDLVQSLWR